MKIAQIMRIDLINIAKASIAAGTMIGTTELTAVLDALTASGPYTEATDDEVDAFDDASEAAEIF
jgi:hypothetical protein